jgi:hypothetical protein
MAVATALHGVGHHDHIHPEPTTFIGKYIFSLDAKVIGVQYMIAGLLFFITSGLLAEVVRIQLLTPKGTILSNDAYNGVYSLHGSGMVWMVIIPLVTGGFGNYVMPLMIGARDVAFPWLNLLSFWLYPVAGVILFSSFLIGAPDAGWTEYPPISVQGPAGTNLWCVAIFLIGVSSTMTGINFMVTILKMRAPGMTFTRMPLFVWGQLATAALNMIATTALAAALLALFLERVFHVPFYDPSRGGRVHHDLADVWDGLRDLPDLRAQTDLRLQDDRVLDCRDRALGLHGLGAPHVHERYGALVADTLHVAHDGDRGADRHQDILVARDFVGW